MPFLAHEMHYVKIENERKENMRMEKTKKALAIGFLAGWITLTASPVFASEISFKGAGTALWIFVIIGAVIVLLQLIPAIILFFSFIGTATTLGFKRGKKVEDEVTLPGVVPVPVKK